MIHMKCQVLFSLKNKKKKKILRVLRANIPEKFTELDMASKILTGLYVMKQPDFGKGTFIIHLLLLLLLLSLLLYTPFLANQF